MLLESSPDGLGLDRSTYSKYLETDYAKRVIEEHSSELGLYGDAREYLGDTTQ